MYRPGQLARCRRTHQQPRWNKKGAGLYPAPSIRDLSKGGLLSLLDFVAQSFDPYVNLLLVLRHKFLAFLLGT